MLTPCWIWRGSLRKGYGQILGRMAHKVIYEEMIGPVPNGLQLDHLCRNRNCVNPYHLEPVTARENLMRGKTLAAANASKTACSRGHAFTEENTYWRKDRLGRNCRICRYESSKRSQERRLQIA